MELSVFAHQFPLWLAGAAAAAGGRCGTEVKQAKFAKRPGINDSHATV